MLVADVAGECFLPPTLPGGELRVLPGTPSAEEEAHPVSVAPRRELPARLHGPQQQLGYVEHLDVLARLAGLLLRLHRVQQKLRSRQRCISCERSCGTDASTSRGGV